MRKKIFILLLAMSMVFTACGKMVIETNKTIGEETVDEEKIEKKKEEFLKKYNGKTAQEITNSLTLEAKASQMVQPAVYNVTQVMMKKNCYGSILSETKPMVSKEWRELVRSYQLAALNSESMIPFIYGQDDVHGVNYALNTVIFPHNIGLGAANDPELMYEVGKVTADEAMQCNMIWNFAPCVAQSVDPRWGRTYESYSSDIEIIKSLSVQYTKGLIDGGMIACAKHFFADGNVVYGTGENSDVARLIDRGEAELSDSEIQELLDVYQAQIDAGVQTIMISHSSLNGIKMHENGKYIKYLKNEMGFNGFIVSDWDSIHNISGETYKDQIIKAVNSGIDMLMEVKNYEDARLSIIDAVNDGKISEERINDAVTRIIQVKMDAGLFEDPFLDNIEFSDTKTGSFANREVAERCVEQSLVLLKNDNDILPLKSGSKVYIMGPAIDNAQVQCGGWTLDWNSSPEVDIQGVTTIGKGLEKLAAEKNITIITDEKEAENADVILLAVGEKAYAEWNGDTEDLDLCGMCGIEGNKSAIENAKSYGKPVVTCIVAGRHVLINDYEQDWDAIVMCYLPGSEGQGIAKVLYGDVPFTGKLPSPWYSSVDQIGSDRCWHEQGWSLNN